MLSFVKRFAVPGCALLVCSLPAIVQADPVRVTGGYAYGIATSEFSSTTLTGDGLNIEGEGISFASSGPGAVGSTTTLNGGFSFFPISGPISQTVDNVPYFALLGGGLTFLTDPFVVVAPPAGGGTEVTFRVPFTMTGQIQGFRATGPTGRTYGEPLFTIDVFGTGFASTTKKFDARSGMYLPVQSTVFYNFAPAASATPEPASMLLLGTGLAGLALRRRKPQSAQS